MWRFVIFVVSVASLGNISSVEETEIKSKPESNPPMINPGFFEGDIGDIFDDNSTNTSKLIEGFLNASFHHGAGDHSTIWPNGVVPYIIDPSLKYVNANIISAMDNIVNATGCIRFVPYSDQQDYLWLFRPRRPMCLSERIGRKGGRQYVALGRGCGSIGVIIHELLHVLGFWHEHTRPNRDAHIIIKEENFTPGISKIDKYMFMRKQPKEMNTFGEPYDYASIMHYDSYAWAKDWNSPTILVRGNPTTRIRHPQYKNLSFSDIKRIKNLYKCKS